MKLIQKVKKFIDKKVNKPIELSKYETTWVKLFKYHYKDKLKGDWFETTKPIFVEIYGWDPDKDNNYNDYLRCMFDKLINIYMKIGCDGSGSNLQIREIISASFAKSITNEYELPIERVIVKIISKISNTPYLNKYKNPRFLLEDDIF